ncbi:MAG: PEP-CTERM-box response regulator transcription factor [Candidatus Obscuribacterales bacterium]|nr:PEP-CTERM-box response regulator transcription factor [Steroidobacteraceae bacterium]
MTSSDRRLLIVEDDPGLQTQLRWCFSDYEVLLAGDRTEAITQVRRFEPAVVLQDLGLPPDPNGATEGLNTLREILQIAPHTKVIVVTGKHERENAIQSIALGAYDFYQKPVDTQLLQLLVARAFHMHALESQVRQLRDANLHEPFEGLITTDDSMLRVRRIIEKVAPTTVSVSLLGESGTGKELLARAIHSLSTRRTGKFVAINCAAIPEALLESELFGYEKGAFTGAVKQTVGKIELANGGTLFLDEIGDMPLPLQAKMLRFLQDRVIERIGGRQEIPVDVRVVCATNQDLTAMIASQRFRQDLYYRISEVVVMIPALRERNGGVMVLAHWMLRRYAESHGRSKRGFSEDALAAMAVYPWPGNVRELENKIKSALILAEGTIITAADLGLSGDAAKIPPLNLKEVRAHAERQAIHQALSICDSNISRCAELLGVSRPTLYDMMEKYGIQS